MRDLLTYATAIAVSVAGHILFIGGLGHAAVRQHVPRDKILEIAVIKKAPARIVEPRAMTAPAAPKPLVEKLHRPQSLRRETTQVPVDAAEPQKPADTAELPPSNSQAETAIASAPPVFGVTMSSTVKGGAGGMKVAVGNTLMMKPGGKRAPGEKVEAYASRAVPVAIVPPAVRGECRTTYPPRAKAAGIEGTVVLLIDIAADGSVSAVKVKKGLGHGLDEAAVRALKACRFEPARRGDRTVPFSTEYLYSFVINSRN